MDPTSAISLAGSVIGIVDVVSRTIKGLCDLRQRWKEADLTVTLLISQLTTLKAALNQIAEWISSSLATESSHHQLIIDLEGCLGSCDVLMRFVERYLSRLDRNENSVLDYESRARIMFADKNLKAYVEHLNNQTNALNLLLTAFNW